MVLLLVVVAVVVTLILTVKLVTLMFVDDVLWTLLRRTTQTAGNETIDVFLNR